MDVEIEAFNWDLRWFVSNLKAFRNNVNKTNNTTLRLLVNTVDSINDLVEGTDIIQTNDSTLLALNEEIITVQRSFFCRICKVSFIATAANYNAHMTSDKHKYGLKEKEVNSTESIAAKIVPSDKWHAEDGNNNVIDAHILPANDDCSEIDMERVKKVENWLVLNTLSKQKDDSISSVDSKPVETKTDESNKIIKPKTHFRFGELSSGARKESNDCAYSKSQSLDITEKSPSAQSNNDVLEFEDRQSCAFRSNCQSNGIIQKKRESDPSKLHELDTPTIKCARLSDTSFFQRNLGPIVSGAVSKAQKISKHFSYTEVASSIQSLLKDNSQSVQCHLIGSRVNGTTTSDFAALDIYLDFDKSLYKVKVDKQFFTRMDNVHRVMKLSADWSKVETTFSDYRASYGILSATHNATKLKCRLVFGTDALVRNNDAVNGLFSVQKLCQPLVLLVRLSMQELNEASWTTKFSGYIVSLLVIFYLQVTKRLPPVKNLASLTTLAGIPMHLDRSSVVLMGWFEYYSKFDFERNIISVFEGTAINKSIRYENKQMLPPNIARFKDLIENEPIKWQKSNMCVQDPFLHSNNVAISIDWKKINKFKSYCSRSLKDLRESRNSHRL